jgi:hypothetical protein
MKSIAILGMAFLPATFFATFVSIPSLGWDGPEKFILYWAFTIPVTVATFVLWAGFTQRGAILELLGVTRKKADSENRMRKV